MDAAPLDRRSMIHDKWVFGTLTSSRSTRGVEPATSVGRRRPQGIEGLESQRESARCPMQEIETSTGVKPEAMASEQCGAS